MIKLNMIKAFSTQPWIVCLIWNMAVLAAAVGMTLHEHNHYWILLCVLVGWPGEYE